jgi:hypothetical protein
MSAVPFETLTFGTYPYTKEMVRSVAPLFDTMNGVYHLLDEENHPVFIGVASGKYVKAHSLQACLLHCLEHEAWPEVTGFSFTLTPSLHHARLLMQEEIRRYAPRFTMLSE